MIPFKSFRYIYPPRPENAVSAERLADYDNGEYIAQPKLNGDCLEVYTNGIEVLLYNRHKQVYKKVPDINLVGLHRETIDGTKNKWMCLVGEFMDKSKINEFDENFNGNFIIFDIIVFDSMQLVGKSFEERKLLLDSLYGKEDCTILDDGIRHHKFLHTTPIDKVFRVKTFRDCFSKLWEDLVKIDVYEGLVLKKAKAPLDNGVTEKNNTLSQVKFRKPTKNYLY